MNLNFIKSDYQKRVILVIVSLIITFITFYPSLNNDFTDWDDDVYVTENDLIREISGENIGKYFTEPVSSNFHPLTIFSLALDYRFFEMNPFYYHLHNLLLHLLNVILVFMFIYLLSKQNLWASFFVALIFGIHPMHVESVAWISERKDLLYTFYFLLGLILYVWKFHSKNWKNYLLILLIFILSMFSKSAAVVFPLVLILIDYHIKGKIKIKDILTKVPFFMISIAIGIIAIRTQQGALHDLGQLSLIERFQVASYGFLVYIFKFFAPVNLNNLALLPEPVPGYFFAFVIGAILIFFYVLIKFIKNPKSEIYFGFFFFLITIILVLQILTVGKAIISERYTYIPYIGLGYCVFILINSLLNRFNNDYFKKTVYLLIGIFIVINSTVAHNRVKVWNNSKTLWTDAIKKDRNNPFAYLNLGFYYYNLNEYEQAINQFNKAIRINPQYKSALYRRHKCFVELKDYASAVQDINTLRQVYDDGFYYDVGIILIKQAKYKEALSEFLKAKKINIESTAGLDLNIGICLLNTGKTEESVLYFNSVISKDSVSFQGYFSRGYAWYKLNEPELAKKDLETSIQINPGHKMSYWYRALIFSEEKNYQESYKDFTEVLRIDPSSRDAYYSRSLSAYYMQKYDLALKDAIKARDLGYQIQDSYIKSLENYTMTQ